MNKSTLKVGFLSSHNYFDRNAWSGTLYQMYQALISQNVEIINLGQQYEQISFWQKVKKRLLSKDQDISIASSEYIDKNQKFATLVKEQLKIQPCDCIFAPVASKEIYNLETKIPIIYLSDITFKLYNGYYPDNFTEEQKECKAKEEATAIERANKLVYPSYWAANSAINDYGKDPSKVVVIPFGANLDKLPSSDEIKQKRLLSSPCRLLFIGKDWERKGGKIAFETLIALNDQGINAELVVVGAIPPQQIKHKKLTVIPFLDKNSPQQRKILYELLWQSHFFIFPTRAECYGIVICEANAFGIPVLATDVGGIPDIIKEGKNGYLFPLNASGEDYANIIAKHISNFNQYQILTQTSRIEYEMRLNWEEWGKKMYELFLTI